MLFQTTLDKYNEEIDNDEYLRKLAYDGLKKRNLSGKKYEDRIEKELSVIINAGLSDFFLNTSYILAMLRENNVIIGPGRGSVGGSLVAYCLNIHQVNPFDYDLSFARFLNETRALKGLPDIDTDIGKSDRKRALELIKTEFGETKTYQVINQMRYTAKTAIKDLARIYGVDFQETNKVTSQIVDDNIETNQSVQAYLNKYPKIRDNYKKFIGLLKNYGVHAGASIILPDDVENYTSILQVTDTWCLDNDGHTCEDDLLMLKNDTLGLATLTIIKDCLNLIDEDIKLPIKDFNDEKVFETINKSQLGIFQLDTAPGSAFTKKLHPDNFNDLVASLALIRPGAQNSGDADRYVACKNDGQPVEYDHPLLVPILKDTYGCLIYQEQAMKIFTDLAGLTDDDADNIRRGIGKKIESVFIEYKPKFIDACLERGIEKQIAETIWGKIEKSSEYSFNKSHSVFYAIIAYQTGWLKTYYPDQFYIAMLNNTDSSEKRLNILSDIKESNTELYNPDINLSSFDTRFKQNNIYIGLGLIDKVSGKVSIAITEERLDGKFTSFDNFCSRVAPRQVNVRVKENLIWAGAFDNVPVLDGQKISNTHRQDLINFLKNENKKIEKLEELRKEFAVLSFSPNEELIDYMKTEFDNKIISLEDIDNIQNVSEFYVKGIIVDVDKKKDYTIIHLSNKNKTISVSFNEQLLRYYNDYLENGKVVIIKCHSYNKRLYAHFLIDINNIDDFSSEVGYISGQSNEKLYYYRNDNIALASQVTYFISKKGNHCVRVQCHTNDNDDVTLISCKNSWNILPKDLKAGDFFRYEKSNSTTFVNNIKKLVI